MDSFFSSPSLFDDLDRHKILCILESNPHPFYSFRGLKNQMWNRITCGLDSRLWAGFWKNDRVAVSAIRTILFFSFLAVLLQAWSGPEGARKLSFPHFMTTAQGGGKVVSLTHRPHLPPGNSHGTHFCQRLCRPQGHSAIGRIMSMKNSSDTIWNRKSDLPICNTTP